MKWLGLNPMDLQVEVFQTSRADGRRVGTAEARQGDTFFWPCQTGTCKSCGLYCLPRPGTC